MFEKYTVPARRAIFFAKFEAGQLGSTEIEPEHIMLGLIRQNKAVVEKSILPGKDLTKFVAKIKAVMFKNPPRNRMVDIPFSDTTKKVLAGADHLADSANQYITVEHLLSSLLPELSPPIKNLWAEIKNSGLDNEY